MLTSLMRRALRLLAPPVPSQNKQSLCISEWSEPMAEQHAAIWWKVKPYTAMNKDRVIALCQSIAYLEKHQIAGAIVECGVGNEGCMMAAALSLLALGSTQRQLFLYDNLPQGESKQALMQTRYPWEKIFFVPGQVETVVPDQVALLRLGSDRYETAYEQLEHLYPRLTERGVLIVHEIDRRQGAKKAVEDYFRRYGMPSKLALSAESEA